MWYFIVAIVLTMIDSAVCWYSLATGPIYSSFIYVIWPGKFGEPIFINFRDPASYAWLTVYFLGQFVTFLVWPAKLLLVVIMLIYVFVNDDIRERGDLHLFGM